LVRLEEPPTFGTIKYILMPYDIQITDTSASLLMRVSREKMEAIEQELKPLIDRVRQLNKEKILDQVKAKVPVQVMQADYDPKAILVNKIAYVLRKIQEPQTSRQIANALLAIDPELAKHPMATYKNVSTILSINKGEGKTFKRIEEEGKDNLFTLND
jgi:hypothetical protein